MITPLTLGVLDDSPLAPAWLVGLGACIAVLAIVSHVDALHGADMPASRRRIRMANGAVMLVLVPVAAYALALASPARPRMFVLVWACVVGLLGVSVMLAAADMLNTILLRRRADRRLRLLLRSPVHGPGAPDLIPRPHEPIRREPTDAD